MMLKAILHQPLRVAGRLIWLAGELLLFAAGYLAMVVFKRGGQTHASRAQWLQWACRRGMRVLNVNLQATGKPPARGLVVSNHLSYLDILVLGSVAPTTFVAKREVARWPVFGWFARKAGTVFLDREKRSDTARAAAAIGEALDGGALLALFPEGTSTDGETVLPFKSALLAPATRGEHLITVSFIQYAIEDGSVAEEVCYWRDMTLVPHLINLLGKSGAAAHVTFRQVENSASDRKHLARQLHAEVLALKRCAVEGGWSGGSSPPLIPGIDRSAKPTPQPI